MKQFFLVVTLVDAYSIYPQYSGLRGTTEILESNLQVCRDIDVYSVDENGSQVVSVTPGIRKSFVFIVVRDRMNLQVAGNFIVKRPGEEGKKSDASLVWW